VGNYTSIKKKRTATEKNANDNAIEC